MSISFNHIPANLRVPGFYVEFDNSLAAIARQNFQLLVIGQMLSTATVAEGEAQQVTRASQAELYFGKGSQLAEMLKLVLAVRPGVEVWAIGLNEDAGGNQAAGSIQITGPATATGAFYVSIAGTVIQVAVSSGDTATEIAAAMQSAIAAETTLPLTAAVDGGDDTLVNLTCKWTGETGNDIDIRTHFLQGGNAIEGVPVNITPMAGGSGNPDIATAISGMGEDWYNWIAMPWTDTANLTALTAELDSRWQPPKQIDARVFIAHRGNLSDHSTFGNTLNNEHLVPEGTNLSPTPPYLWAAVYAAVAAKSLSIDPARPLQGLALPGIKGADRSIQFTHEERQVLLFDGIGTHTVDRDGTVRIERAITSYQDDTSYLDVNTPETLSRIRFEQRTHFANTYGRHKLAENGTQFGAGQAVITPAIARGQLSALYRSFENRGWVEDYDGYMDTLIVQVGDGNGGGDRNRLNVQDQPNLVNQFRIYAHQMQFRP